jgi:hypothetical protein
MIVLEVLVLSIETIVLCRFFNQIKNKILIELFFFRTPFTREERYNYIDPDYAYTDEERQKIEIHENTYNQLFDEQRFQRTEIKRIK